MCEQISHSLAYRQKFPYCVAHELNVGTHTLHFSKAHSESEEANGSLQRLTLIYLYMCFQLETTAGIKYAATSP